MNIKQKIEDAKSKFKHNAPDIIFYSSVTVIGLLASYGTYKAVTEAIAPRKSVQPLGECILITTREVREMISDKTFEVTHIDDDLYRLSLISTEN